MDRIMANGFAIAALGVVLATIALLIAIAYTVNTPAPQVVRLVSLVPSPGSVILGDVGDSATLTVRGYYSDLTIEDLEADFITYESTDPSVVSVSPAGVVTANDSGGADIIVRFGGFSKRVHALVLGDIPTLPQIDPNMVGPIPDLDEEVRVVLNRVIVELRRGYDKDDAADIAAELGGAVLLSYRVFPGHVIEFDSKAHALLDVLADLETDPRIDAAYPDILFEELDHTIDTLSPDNNMPVLARAYYDAKFEGAWRMVEKAPDLNPVVMSIVGKAVLNVSGQDQHPVIDREFDSARIRTTPWTNILTSPDDAAHAAAVASVLVAVNDGLPSNPNFLNFSGIVTSVDNLPYDLIALGGRLSLANIPVVSLSDTLRQLDIISIIQQNGTISIDVVNMSFGTESVPIIISRRGIALVNEYVTSAVTPFIEGNPSTIFVVAAGNDPIDAEDIFPARLSMKLDNVITVGGANAEYNGRWTDSAFGDAITVAAPAEGVLTVYTGNSPGYAQLNGTSLAAPMVTGAVALLKAIDSDLEPREVKKLLVETGDEKTICTTYSSETSLCTKEETWSFLRADKAVAKLLSDRVRAEVGDRVFVPGESQRVVEHEYDFGVSIENDGEIEWPLYAQAFLRMPNGVESESPLVAENAVAPQGSHPFRWQFSPSAHLSGCWDLKVKVWMENPDGGSTSLTDALKVLVGREDTKGGSTFLIDALTALDPNMSNPGLLADTGWMREVLEVRAAPDQPLSCSGSDKVIPLPLPSPGEQPGSQNIMTRAGQTANVLLLADTSGSMEGQKIAALKEAIDIFTNRMYEIRFQSKGGIDQNPDHVGLANFDQSYVEVLPIGPIGQAGAGLDAWKDAADSLYADGGTTLYDAVIQAVDVLESQDAPARSNVLIALTDGLDQGSGSSFGDAIDRLKESSVTLFALALSESGETGSYDFGVLEEMANATGGAAYAADTTNLSGLYELFSTIFEIER